MRLAAYPKGLPTSNDFELCDEPIPEPQSGQILCRTLLLSIDPYVRVMMLQPDSHIPGASNLSLKTGAVIPGRTVSEVIASRVAGYEPGDLVVSNSGWQEFGFADVSDVRKLPNETALLDAYLSVLGMPGFTAYAGLRFVGRQAPGKPWSYRPQPVVLGLSLGSSHVCKVLGPSESQAAPKSANTPRGSCDLIDA